jgi:RNA polymerase sigma factor (sigma-70 family)
LIADLLARGDAEAARQLWERHKRRMIGLALAELKKWNRPGAGHEAEDVAQSAIKDFFEGIREERFTRLRDRNDLWFLLATITAHKAHDHAERARRKKRGGGWNDLGESALAGIACAEPSPSDAVMMIEELDRLLDALGDPTLRQIATWKMEGYTNEEIAERLGCARRTVYNKLELIRRRWIEGGQV